MTRLAILFACVVVSVAPSRAEDDPFPRVTAKVEDWMARGYYKGAGLWIAKGDRVLYEKCFGECTPETEFFIASAGKWLASATLMSVVDDGRLSLDDPAAKWLPEFREDPKGAATVRQMLSHTSGYPGYQPEDKPRDDYQTLAESVAHLMPLPPVTKPGERFDYGGLAMQAAGRMAEIATGRDWEKLFQERIAKPLGMERTRFTPVDSGGGHSPMLGGGAVSTLRDYSKFLTMIAERGSFEGKRVLSEGAVSEMEADQLRGAFVKQGEFIERIRGAKHPAIYGLGLWREELDTEGKATLVSSPSWAGAYPWVDRRAGVRGVFITHVDVDSASVRNDRFSGFYSSPVIAMMVREGVATGAMKKGDKAAIDYRGK
ncbi:MAG TPA: serine hydrolase domain-containing protein [Luteolibacter sp.]